MTSPEVKPGGGAALAIALALAVAAAIAWLSLEPSRGKPRPGEDKVDHAIAYATLAAFSAGAVWRSGTAVPRAAALAFAAAVLYGGGIEIIQPRFGRSGEWLDEAANATGAAVGAGAWLLWRRRRAARVAAAAAGAP